MMMFVQMPIDDDDTEEPDTLFDINDALWLTQYITRATSLT